MGRYEKYRKQKTIHKKRFLTIRNIVLVVLLLVSVIGFVIQIVMNAKN